MASAVEDEGKFKKSKKPRRRSNPSCSKELLEPQGKPDLVARLKELGSSKKKVEPTIPPKTFRVDSSFVLSRVKCFLPELERADQELQLLLEDTHSKQGLDIENLEEGEPCIEMTMAVIPVAGDDCNDSDSSSCSSGSEEETGKSEQRDHSSYLPLVKNKHKKLIEEVK